MTVDGVNVLAAKVNVADMNNLRTMMDDKGGGGFSCEES
ncbi:Uncharacterised protein [Streptococcus pneumoniae]|nr:Uncharacterised protein [Streptococcus pneumoniae]